MNIDLYRFSLKFFAFFEDQLFLWVSLNSREAVCDCVVVASDLGNREEEMITKTHAFSGSGGVILVLKNLVTVLLSVKVNTGFVEPQKSAQSL